MKDLRNGLGVLLLTAIVIGLAAWLVAPALPLVVVLFVLVSIVVLVFGRTRTC